MTLFLITSHNDTSLLDAYYFFLFRPVNTKGFHFAHTFVLICLLTHCNTTCKPPACLFLSLSFNPSLSQSACLPLSHNLCRCSFILSCFPRCCRPPPRPPSPSCPPAAAYSLEGFPSAHQLSRQTCQGLAVSLCKWPLWQSLTCPTGTANIKDKENILLHHSQHFKLGKLDAPLCFSGFTSDPWGW